MGYNKFLYNEALYNAGRDEAGALIKSIISAHTGPHIQATVGQGGGLSFISDFTIQEGSIRKPPSSFNFPDLSARIQSVVFSDLGADIFGVSFADLPACVFPVAFIPNLPATIFALGQANLLATILGKLAEKDLQAIIQVTVANLSAIMTGVPSPSLGGRVFVQPPGNLGARIHAPLDLLASIFGINRSDLLASIQPLAFGDLSGTMLGVPAPNLLGFIRAFVSATSNLPATLSSRDASDLPATVFGLRGLNDVGADITGSGGFRDVVSAIRSEFIGAPGNLAATIGIEFGVISDLVAVINQIGAHNLSASIGANLLGVNDKFLSAVVQPVHTSNLLPASIISNSNLRNLGAILTSTHGQLNLGATITVSETFITALLTVTTLAARDLRAVIGAPSCSGGTGTATLAASAITQHAQNLGAAIQSFIIDDLGAKINTDDIFYAFDVIRFSFSPYRIRNTRFLATDTIPFKYSPFRGQNLGAFIQAIQPAANLGASLTAVFPLPRVTPSVSSVIGVDLRPGQALNIQQIRLQLEGALLEYFYVNGTEEAFIRDVNEDWKINVRSFQPIAANIFGDFAAARVCRLGSLTSFSNLDEAVRSCIDFVLGLDGQSNLGASIQSKGANFSLPASIGISNNFENLSALANRVFPSELLNSVIEASGGFGEITGVIIGTSPSSASMSATVCVNCEVEKNLGATITAV